MAEGTRALWRPRPAGAPHEKEARFSIPSLLAIAAAIVSFAVSAGWGLLLAGLAIFLGVVGFILALAPGVRGGVVSVLSLIAGGAAIIVALVKLIVPG